MTLLLDTHVLIWFAQGDSRLPRRIRDRVEEEEDVQLSVASVWEMAIKTRVGRLTWRGDFRERVQALRNEHGIRLLDISREHAFAVATLPRHHADPFDLLL